MKHFKTTTHCDLIIIGASGFVGHNLTKYFSSRCSVIGTYHKHPLPRGLEAKVRSIQLDVRDQQQVRLALSEFRPQAVLHVAGNKNLKDCEKFPSDAYEVNAIGAQNVARACKGISAKMIYLSTDLIFDCSRGWYTENDIPLPNTVYGKTKLEGERLSKQELDDISICRSGGIYGPGSPLLGWASANLTKNLPLNCFINVFNTPTYVYNLAEMVDVIIKNNFAGVFHTVGSQRISRFDFFLNYAEQFEFDPVLIRPTIHDQKSDHFLLQPDASLSTEITRSRLQTPFFSVTEGLRRLRELETRLYDKARAIHVHKG
ncbi:MAG: SDR family oxidoreductase [Deltaproteobacteria bacterium]|nr:SDR family oxidoreductase [Deltaproteobacteria bacterium]